MTIPNPAGDIESLLEWCTLSASTDNANVVMTRYFQVVIWVDGRNVTAFRRIRSCVERQIQDHSLGSVINGASWGPFEDSRYGVFFGRTSREMTEKDFQDGLYQVALDFDNKCSVQALERQSRALLILGPVGIGTHSAWGPSIKTPSYYFHVPASLCKDLVSGNIPNVGEHLEKLFPSGNSPGECGPPTESDALKQVAIRRLRQRRSEEQDA